MAEAMAPRRYPLAFVCIVIGGFDGDAKIVQKIFFKIFYRKICKVRFLPYICTRNCGNSSVGRAQPCQGWGREFESRFPLKIKGLEKSKPFSFSLQTSLSLARELRRVADGDLMRRLFCGGSAIWQGMRSYATKNLGQKAYRPNNVSPMPSDRSFRQWPRPARLRSPSDEVRVHGNS